MGPNPADDINTSYSIRDHDKHKNPTPNLKRNKSSETTGQPGKPCNTEKPLTDMQFSNPVEPMDETGNTTPNPNNGEIPSQLGCLSPEEEEDIRCQETEAERIAKIERQMDAYPINGNDHHKHKRVYNLRDTMNYVLSEIEMLKNTRFQATLDLDAWIRKLIAINGGGKIGKPAESMIAHLAETNAYLTRNY